MDKQVIFAVAGSGKTTYIINNLNLSKRSLIIIYTVNNVLDMKEAIIEKFSFLPSNIQIMSYFDFLYGFCYKPYLSYSMRAKGILFKPCQNRFATGDDRYMSRGRMLYSNRIAKLFEYKEIIPAIQKRLEKYFDCLYVDEVQDIAGYDFNLLGRLSQANIECVCVGDFYQHTYDTSRDGAINKTLHDNLEAYIDRFKKFGLKPMPNVLSHSYRCSPSVCTFVSDNLGIQIKSNQNTGSKITFIENIEEANNMFNNDGIIKLFYQTHYRYNCSNSNNWGKVKGCDKHLDVCVVLNATTLKAYEEGNLNNLPPQTKNKLYVAITRAKRDVYFVPEKLYMNNKS